MNYDKMYDQLARDYAPRTVTVLQTISIGTRHIFLYDVLPAEGFSVTHRRLTVFTQNEVESQTITVEVLRD